MINKQLIKQLSTDLSYIVENDIAMDAAVAILDRYNTSTPNLSMLLTEYQNVDPVFSVLLKPQKTEKNTALFVHLVKLNPNILYMLETKGDSPNNTLFQYFLDRQEKFKGIIGWLESNMPALIAAERLEALNIKQWYELAFSLLGVDSIKFQESFANKSIKSVHQLLTVNDSELLDELIIPPLDNLNFIVTLDLSILRRDYGESDLFSYLCEDPMTYLPTLTIIKEKYSTALNKDELRELNAAFKTERERLQLLGKSKPLRMQEMTPPTKLNNSSVTTSENRFFTEPKKQVREIKTNVLEATSRFILKPLTQGIISAKPKFSSPLRTGRTASELEDEKSRQEQQAHHHSRQSSSSSDDDIEVITFTNK